jgi:hypothetical protein
MRALQRLEALLGVGTAKMERMLSNSYFHDWQIDPYSRGAYSYAKVGASEAPAILAQPVQDTLFFAGEASDVTGNNGTVHGAIASGRRAVIMPSRSSRPDCQSPSSGPRLSNSLPTQCRLILSLNLIGMYSAGFLFSAGATVADFGQARGFARPTGQYLRRCGRFPDERIENEVSQPLEALVL